MCRQAQAQPAQMQARAILEAALNSQAKGIVVKDENMNPLVGTVREFAAQVQLIRETAAAVFAERQASIDYLVGTMIETPRGALVADSIGKQASGWLNSVSPKTAPAA